MNVLKSTITYCIPFFIICAVVLNIFVRTRINKFSIRILERNIAIKKAAPETVDCHNSSKNNKNKTNTNNNSRKNINPQGEKHKNRRKKIG